MGGRGGFGDSTNRGRVVTLSLSLSPKETCLFETRSERVGRAITASDGEDARRARTTRTRAAVVPVAAGRPTDRRVTGRRRPTVTTRVTSIMKSAGL